MDIVDKATRSRMMAGIGGRNTKPEVLIRRALHGAGFRFRLHRRDLPGSPDIVLPKHRVAIQVHGCFWHRHANCQFTTFPSTNAEFWRKKFRDNVQRDSRKKRALQRLGWKVYTIWECEAARPERVARLLNRLHQLRCKHVASRSAAGY